MAAGSIEGSLGAVNAFIPLLLAAFLGVAIGYTVRPVILAILTGSLRCKICSPTLFQKRAEACHHQPLHKEIPLAHGRGTDQSHADVILQKPNPFDSSKRQGYLSWDDYFMAIAFLSAQRSKDPNRQVGACLVSQDRVILGIGYNGFPRGCSDDVLPWAKLSVDDDPLKTKYPYVCHAEVNAILNKNHASARGQRLYVTMFPCHECAKIIIQAGVAEVVYFSSKKSSSDCSYTASRKLMSMAGVKVWQHQPGQEKIILELR